MRLESLTVELRPRSNWEAMELGTALVRRHAGAIWAPWLIATGAAFVVLNAIGVAMDKPWLALLLMWWLRPLFDRIPLYVVSRAVFGGVPRTGETLRAQATWGWKTMIGYLTWRRLNPFRATTLPIDLLEGASGVRLRERRRVIGGGSGGHAFLLMTVCSLFVVVLYLSAMLIPLLFVNEEQMSDATREAFSTLFDRMPAWLQVLLNAVDWLGVSFVEPFFVGAGFGLYLNRRTELEAWDVEIAFRRMRRRLDALAGGVVLALLLALPCLLAWPVHAFAQDAGNAQAQSADAREDADTKTFADDASGEPADDAQDDGQNDSGNDNQDDNQNDGTNNAGNGGSGVDASDDDKAAAPQVETRTLDQIFGKHATDDDGGFGKAVARTAGDPLLHPKENVSRWEWRGKADKTPTKMPKPEAGDGSFVQVLSAIFGFIAENLLWILLGVLIVALAMTARRWWPWMRGFRAEPEPEPEPVEVQTIARDEPLPPNVAATARQLWAQGQPRRALALLYRASVAAVVARTGAHLPPGATEAECLRVARRLPESLDRDAFQRVVRVWQYAAYGHTLPEASDFDALLAMLSQRFGWSS